MKLSDFDYNLPKELIAQYPCAKRDGSRLMVLDRETGIIAHREFRDIVGYLDKGDVLVLNDAKVMPARLIGRKRTGGRVEVLLLERIGEGKWRCLVKPAKMKNGTRIFFDALSASLFRDENGEWSIQFASDSEAESLFQREGSLPLPPYIRRAPEPLDNERYQTVYAKNEGAIAAPTAGLHFSKEILNELSLKGVELIYITLYVGYGTFKPVREEEVVRHSMEPEYFEVSKDANEKLCRAKMEGRRIIAVGTTSCRALETIGTRGLGERARDKTDIFIYPGYEFKLTQGLLTNFHLPRTTLLMLVSALCSREFLFKAYKEAIEENYRFYSYGDAMLIF